jgi:Amt family ammonium transporter
VNDAGANGLFFGDFSFFKSQLIAVGVCALYSFGITVGLLKLIDLTIGLRVEEEDEVVGLDISQHGENGYQS